MCDAYHSFLLCFVFFFKQKTAYEMRISDWSSDVCSSDLAQPVAPADRGHPAQRIAKFSGVGDEVQLVALAPAVGVHRQRPPEKIGRASCRERVCQYV